MTIFSKICFINNYNNGPFLSDCLNSVFSQTIPFDKVIIVDDGSTDVSLEVLAQYQKQHTNLEVYSKPNGGQLSTFNFIAEIIPLDSQIFLLDGDDMYPPDYLELVLAEFKHKPWDFAFCEHQKFRSIDDKCLKSSKLYFSQPLFFPVSSAITRSRHSWIGNVTSTISISGLIFKKIFPYPAEDDVILWTDNIIIYAASILGCKKTYLNSLSIGWRAHNNNDSSKSHSSQYLEKKNQDMMRVIMYFCKKAGVDLNPTILEFYSEYLALSNAARRYLNLPNHWRLINRILGRRYLFWLYRLFDIKLN